MFEFVSNILLSPVKKLRKVDFPQLILPIKGIANLLICENFKYFGSNSFCKSDKAGDKI